eukprot:452894_1
MASNQSQSARKSSRKRKLNDRNDKFNTPAPKRAKSSKQPISITICVNAQALNLQIPPKNKLSMDTLNRYGITNKKSDINSWPKYFRCKDAKEFVTKYPLTQLKKT